jgi:hypothetical protein
MSGITFTHNTQVNRFSILLREPTLFGHLQSLKRRVWGLNNPRESLVISEEERNLVLLKNTQDS